MDQPRLSTCLFVCEPKLSQAIRRSILAKFFPISYGQGENSRLCWLNFIQTAIIVGMVDRFSKTSGNRQAAPVVMDSRSEKNLNYARIQLFNQTDVCLCTKSKNTNERGHKMHLLRKFVTIN